MKTSRRILRTVGSALVPRSLQSQMILLLGALVLVQIAISGVIFGSLIADVTEAQIGKRALDIAKSVARDPLVHGALANSGAEGAVQELAESVRQATGAEYVVVCDSTARRLSHPDAWKIGLHFVGGDTGPVLEEGLSYTSKAVGTLGPSLRGFAPVRGDDGTILGFVAVGYLLEDVDRIVHGHQLQPRVWVFMMALVGLLAAVMITDHFKKAILGLEPRQIASLYQQRSTILETIREGVVAIDPDGLIQLANPAARRALDLDPAVELVGRPVREIFPRAGMDDVLRDGREILDREVVRNGRELIVNMIPVRHEGRIVGVVASFRRKDELDQLARELSSAQEYSEMLRVQAHEHSNHLHTIAGLIQIEAHQEALDLILSESMDYQDIIRFLADAVPDPTLSGLILGKLNRASELKVAFVVDRESTMRELPEWLDPQRLVTILGNLLDNALEAAVAGPPRPAGIHLSMTDLGHDLVFEIEDTGAGIPDDQQDHVFTKGVTSKPTPGHGVGLYLVAENLRELGGAITVERGSLGGAILTVIIPKTRSDNG